MITVAIIAFREFLEAFLIVGVFLGISGNLKLNKEKEILLATLMGIVISLALGVLTYFLGSMVSGLLSEENTELIENLLLLFSGIFLAYVVFSLHEKIGTGKNLIVHKAKAKLENQAFDFSLFILIVFLVVREGFEIALFTASTSLFSAFIQNIWGFVSGLLAAVVIGIIAYAFYSKFPIKKVFGATGFMVILLGASMVQVGVTELLEQVSIHLGDFLPFGFGFLPDEHSLAGNLIRTFTGVDREFSLARLLIMFLYGCTIYFLLKKEKFCSGNFIKKFI